MELTLVHVQTYPHNTVADMISLQPVFYQYPTNLGITPIDIIRPLDAQVANPFSQGLTDSLRHLHGNSELPVGWDIPRVQQHGEQQVLSSLRFPRVLTLSAACCLVVSPYHHIILPTLFTKPAVGRIRLVDMDDFPFHVAKLRKNERKAK